MLQYRKIYYILSGALVVASIIFIAVFGLNFGIDFKGGSVMDVSFKETRPDNDLARSALVDIGIKEAMVQKAGERGMVIRLGEISEQKHQEIIAKLKSLGDFRENSFESVGPVIGSETKSKAVWATAIVLVMILVYIAWAFRKVSFPVGSWVYGLAALVALFHDVVITIGVFAIIGNFFNIEVGIPFVAALLTILGYSVNDTIVVFDRLRENVLKAPARFNFGDLINKAVRQTYVRSLNTSLTTFLVLFAVLLLGGETIKYFILTLIIGILAGTYSSIFLASPLLFSVYMFKFKK